MWRSRTIAEPRMVARDWPASIPTTVTGELCGRLIWNEPVDSGASCARRTLAPRRPKTASRICPLVCIHVIHGHVARFGVDVTSPDRTLRAGRVQHALLRTETVRIHETQRGPAAANLDAVAIRGGLHHERVVRNDDGVRRGPFHHETGDEQRDHAGHGDGGAEAVEASGVPQRDLAGADAFAGFEAEADVGLHFGGEPVPRNFGN